MLQQQLGNVGAKEYCIFKRLEGLRMWLFLDFIIPELNTYIARCWKECVLPDLLNSVAWYGFNVVLLHF